MSAHTKRVSHLLKMKTVWSVANWPCACVSAEQTLVRHLGHGVEMKRGCGGGVTSAEQTLVGRVRVEDVHMEVETPTAMMSWKDDWTESTNSSWVRWHFSPPPPPPLQ